MKLKKDFIVHETKDETMVVATGKAKFSGLVRGNKMLGEILSLMKKDTTEAEVVRAMRAKFDAPEGKIEADVHKTVTELRRIGAIED
ncbi:MAG: PqqD family protein [Ruminococcus sp.]|nr:PqqD family protein [Ruminococcus sp.]MBQ7070695.1 PqqD family protein [Ruminococcus sp.]